MAIIVDDNNFKEKVENSKIPTVMDFWAEWCMPCKMFGPIFEKTAEEFKGKVNFAKVNTDTGQDISRRFNIMSIPCIVFFKDGSEVHRAIGMQSQDNLKALVKEHLL
jgi:thioredoxin 1